MESIFWIYFGFAFHKTYHLNGCYISFIASTTLYGVNAYGFVVCRNNVRRWDCVYFNGSLMRIGLFLIKCILWECHIEMCFWRFDAFFISLDCQYYIHLHI